jgi:hypothetical protein
MAKAVAAPGRGWLAPAGGGRGGNAGRLRPASSWFRALIPSAGNRAAAPTGGYGKERRRPQPAAGGEGRLT